MKGLFNKKRAMTGTYGPGQKHSHRLLRGQLFSKVKDLNYLIVCITRCTFIFQYVCFLLPICLPCISCGTYCNEHKCCVVTHRTADFRVAWLVYLACLRSYVLRAYCNFESKQAIAITLFGRRQNKTMPNYCDWPQMYRRHLQSPQTRTTRPGRSAENIILGFHRYIVMPELLGLLKKND